MGTCEDSIDRLYNIYDILSNAKDNIKEHEAEYKEILDAVKGTGKEKRLASQFIGKFFKFFPELQDDAIDAQLDLCEDEDIQIRKQAIRELPHLCKDTKAHTAKIADILAQLLIVEDTSELQQVHMSLQSLLKLDTKGTLTGIFSQIQTGDELTRDRSFKFLLVKLKSLGTSIITSEIEDFLIAEIKKILSDVSADEFHTCMEVLATTKLGSTISGHSELVRLIVEQAELDSNFDLLTIDDEIVERFIQCATHALPYFSSQVDSTKFINFMCEKFLPLGTWNIIGATEEQDQMQLRLLKVFAEMCKFCGQLEKPQEYINSIYTVLQEYMPLPPFDTKIITTTTAAATTTTTTAAAVVDENPSFQFSHAECLLYALHSLGKQSADYFQFSNDQLKLKDFRSRLQYLARGTQGYIKSLQEAIKGKKSDDLKSDENQIKITALKTTSNISTLIRDLFHSPPIFKTLIQLSWITKKSKASLKGSAATTTAAAAGTASTPETSTDATKTATKRHAPITFGDGDGGGGGSGTKSGGGANGGNGKNSKKQKTTADQKVYAPPSGKYSAKMQNYGNRNRNGGGGGGGRIGGGGGGGGGFRSGGNNNGKSFRRY